MSYSDYKYKIQQDKDGAAFIVTWITGTVFCCGAYLITRWIARKLGFENADAIVMGFISAETLVLAGVALEIKNRRQ